MHRITDGEKKCLHGQKGRSMDALTERETDQATDRKVNQQIVMDRMTEGQTNVTTDKETKRRTN